MIVAALLAVLVPAQCESGWQRFPAGDLPAPRYAGGVVYDPIHGRTLVFGGSGFPARLWEFRGSAWNQVITAGPQPDSRQWGRMVWNEQRRTVVLMGGLGPDQHAMNDVWELDTSGVWSRWNPVPGEPSPEPRWLPAVCYDPRRNVVVMFGGTKGWTIFDIQCGEMWEWDQPEGYDHARWFRRDGADALTPPARTYAAMAFDRRRGVCVLHGGFAFEGFTTFGDTWEWDGSFWTRGPDGPPMQQHSLVYDEARGVIVATANWIDQGGDPYAPNQVWEYNGLEWKLRATDGPSPRWFAQAVYDPSRGVVLIGGYNYPESYAEMWIWPGAEELAADLNHDGYVDFTDYLEFLGLYDAADPGADLNGDGLVDFGDFLEFLRWFEGC